MPELPEVETVRRTLSKLVVGRTIRDVDVFLEKMIRNVDVDELKCRLEGRTIQKMDRYGKHLMFDFGAFVLMSHLRMEGKYFLRALDAPRDKHEHVIFYFTDGETLRYHDTRQFGTFDLIDKDDLPSNSPIAGLGPEPYSEDLTYRYLRDKLKNKTVAVKPALLDQSIIAGLGNIYVDEVLFRSRIHPETSCADLKPKDIKAIIHNSKVVIERAIELGGSSVRSYTASLGVTGRFQNELLVHTKVDEACPICQTTIIKTKVGGRGTYLCPRCQKKRRKRR